MPPSVMKQLVLPIVSPSIKGGSPTSGVRRNLFTGQGTGKEPTDTQVAQTEEIANDFQSAEVVAEVAGIPQSVGTKRSTYSIDQPTLFSADGKKALPYP